MKMVDGASCIDQYMMLSLVSKSTILGIISPVNMI